ncbi:helix-turn-helix domain-containing protein [Actinomadura barringtoniae]|uniref:Helix-turn-helix domain-containing protein n=1 Tax=Actinomadura barringtoniae TaxID=1427535 RepID=A0A939PBJ1_9ACTN|nr:helix-turn-helix domain-containing protein [Actinomadura barringtoniae]MBO2449555.1 helix-turn-helix domain-containing protein [Actinomadura barringtoniae]
MGHPRKHIVAVLALDGVVATDLALPLDAFDRVRLPDGSLPYRVRVCGPEREIAAEMFGMTVPYGMDALAEADTIVVPGHGADPSEAPAEVLEALRTAARRGVRILSICVGSFILAEAGILDGKRATTHWIAANDMARRYPAVQVDPNVLYVDNGQILTSAGAAAGLDLCLYVIRRDHGPAVAADAARLAVMPLERDGGQAQFIVHEHPVKDGASLGPLLLWLEDNSHRELTLKDIAEQASMSTRTLSRRFREQTGTTPLRWLHITRLRRAQHLLETTGCSIDHIARQVGFGSTTTFREWFREVVGTSPQSYRRSFRGANA